MCSASPPKPAPASKQYGSAVMEGAPILDTPDQFDNVILMTVLMMLMVTMRIPMTTMALMLVIVTMLMTTMMTTRESWHDDAEEDDVLFRLVVLLVHFGKGNRTSTRTNLTCQCPHISAWSYRESQYVPIIHFRLFPCQCKCRDRQALRIDQCRHCPH